ncbi:MAG: VWA domain-containing protein [Chloroflexaceae bacterium]|nr:VWA domain-containing protein [Chloroflexaceae bacterium]
MNPNRLPLTWRPILSIVFAMALLLPILVACSASNSGGAASPAQQAVAEPTSASADEAAEAEPSDAERGRTDDDADTSAPKPAPTMASGRDDPAFDSVDGAEDAELELPAEEAMPEALPLVITPPMVVGEPISPPPPPPAVIEGDEAIGVAPGDTGAGSGDAVDSFDPEAPAVPDVRRPQGQPAALKAGEINDNEAFADYLDYVSSYYGPTIRDIDISERYLITVANDQQQPLYDATVRIYDGETQVFEGRTYTGGKTLFLPGALDVSENAQQLRVVAERGNASSETTIERGQSETLELIIPGAESPAELKLDLLFLLDTTGSMGDELGRIQETIDSIAQRIDAFEPRPQIRYGLVAYRDHGQDEAYTQLTYDFTDDLSTFRKLLNGLDAAGGGDTPEALNDALHQAVQGVQWSDDAVRLVFLVADASPHMDSQQTYNYLDEAQAAVARGIKIYPIAASNTDDIAEYVFRQLAQQTMGGFIFLTYQAGASGGVPGESRDDLDAGEQQYTVERLDDLIVQVVERELAAAIGSQ